jgi:hypothetical protein
MVRKFFRNTASELETELEAYGCYEADGAISFAYEKSFFDECYSKPGG